MNYVITLCYSLRNTVTVTITDFKVLSRVKGKIEAFASSCPDYTDLCDRASQFLIQRESQPFKDNYDVTVKEELKDQFKKIEKKIKKKAEEAEKVRLMDHYVNITQ